MNILFFFVVSAMDNRGKVIIKGICNIWICYSITIIKGEYSTDATVFREIKDLIPFHVFLIFQFLSKYLS